MTEMKKLPIGIEFFREFKSDNFYYVDKTGFIAELLRTRGSVNLFTRPRRFGKSLNMDMLKSFFEIGADASLFEGLEISRDTELFGQHLGKYPVISISLKDVKILSFAIRRHPVITAKYKFAFVFSTWLNKDRISRTILG